MEYLCFAELGNVILLVSQIQSSSMTCSCTRHQMKGSMIMDPVDAQKILDLYIHDYIMKKNLHKTAEIFAREANVVPKQVAINLPHGFLMEWWALFWDAHCSRLQFNPEAAEATENGGQNFFPMLLQPPLNQQASISMQQNHQQAIGSTPQNPFATFRRPELNQQTMNVLQTPCPMPNPEMDQQRFVQFPVPLEFVMHQGEPISTLLAKMYEQDCLRCSARDMAGSTQHPDVGTVNPVVASSSKLSFPQQQNLEDIQQWLGRDHSHRTLEGSNPVVLNPQQASQATLPKREIPDAGKNKGVQQSPVTGYPLGDLGLISPALGCQVSNSLLSLVNQQQHIPASVSLCEQDILPALAAQRSGKLVSSASDWKDAEMDKSMEEVIEAYLSFGNENADKMDILYNTLLPNSSAHDQNEAKGLSFTEAGSLHSSNKLLCCHFSLQGRLLAAAGHEKKVLIWNMENYSVNSIEGHSNIITDIRFSPNSTVFATSSFDKGVLVWDASKPRTSLFKLIGHNEPVMSLDFHPRKVDLLCSCDRNNEIRMWNVSKCTCAHIFQGASRKVRFQTRFGDLLATASRNIINLIDVETNSTIVQLKGHIKDVRTFCWDMGGKYIASVSEDSARIWSINSSRRCIHELQCTGNRFESCIFHPSYSQLLVIGTNKIIQLWNPTESSRTWSYDAHNNKIAALADSPQTKTIATASHDGWVKLWK